MTNFMKRAGLLMVLTLSLLPGTALAYVGPGASLGAIAVIVALALGVLLLIIGLVWYPLKRMLKSKKSSDSSTNTDS